MNAFGLTVWDWIVLAVYLAGITCIGLYAARYVKDTADYFMAGRRFRKSFMVFFTFGAGTHSDQAVSVASKTYTDETIRHLVPVVLVIQYSFLLVIPSHLPPYESADNSGFLRSALCQISSSSLRVRRHFPNRSKPGNHAQRLRFYDYRRQRR